MNLGCDSNYCISSLWEYIWVWALRQSSGSDRKDRGFQRKIVKLSELVQSYLYEDASQFVCTAMLQYDWLLDVL